MALTAEQKKNLPADVLQEIEDQEKEVARLNYENADRRKKYNDIEKDKRASETALNTLREKMEKLGFKSDEDIEEQFPGLIEKVTKDKGLKPATEFDALTKKLDAINKKLELAEAAAAKEKHDAMIEKVGGIFDPALSETFGKAAPIIKDLLRTKGKFAMKDGVAGIQNGDEFVPLTAEKGSPSAIDLLKKDFADMVVTKQRLGTGGSPNAKTGTTGNEILTREEFDNLPPAKRTEYMAKVGQLAENVA